MNKVNQIITGTINNILNREEDLFNSRISVCRSCKLLKIDSIFGEICNPRLYLNPVTNETSDKAMPGYTHGCGCVLRSKCRSKQSHCPLDRW